MDEVSKCCKAYMYRKQVPPHVGEYCQKCNKWQRWVPKTASEYVNASRPTRGCRCSPLDLENTCPVCASSKGLMKKLLESERVVVPKYEVTKETFEYMQEHYKFVPAKHDDAADAAAYGVNYLGRFDGVKVQVEGDEEDKPPWE